MKHLQEFPDTSDPLRKGARVGDLRCHRRNSNRIPGLQDGTSDSSLPTDSEARLVGSPTSPSLQFRAGIGDRVLQVARVDRGGYDLRTTVLNRGGG